MRTEATPSSSVYAAAEQRRLLAGLLAEKRLRPRTFPASYPQEGLWFLHQLEPALAAYNVPLALRLSGRLQPQALVRGLREIVRRHWTLRTSLAPSPGGGVQVEQVVAPFSPVSLPIQDLGGLPAPARDRELGRLVDEQTNRPFDLAAPPLFRVGLVRLATREHVLHLTFHHAIFDGWSMGVLVRELTACYRAGASGEPVILPELPIQYVDFAHWQRQRLAQGALAAQVAYWRQRLDGLPESLALPADRPRPPHWSFRGRACAVELPAGLAAALAGVARQAAASPFMALLAGFHALLLRYTGQHDLAVGTPIANRNRSELEGLIGFCANTLVLRLRAGAGWTFADLLGEVRRSTLAAYANQDLPFELLVQELRPERDLSRSPLFQAMLALHDAPLPPIALPEVDLTVLEVEKRAARFDLLLELRQTAAGWRGLLEYGTDLLDAATASRIAGHYRNVLLAIAAEPRRRVAELSLLSPAERQQLQVECNDTAITRPRELCLHHLVAARAARSPDAIAVCSPEGWLTHGELELASDRLAGWLRQRGVGPETIVGVLLERSLAMVVALLGVLKAGGAYLPLDPSYPRDRLAFCIADAAPRLVLTASGLAGLVPAGAPAVLLDSDWSQIVAASASPPAAAASPDGLAYVIYTSGSTGRPKGAMNSHRGIVNRILWMQEAYGLGAGDRVLQKTPFSFDVSVWELFWPLAVGARLVMAEPGGHRDPAYLIAAIARHEITTLHFVPSMLRIFLEAEGVESCAGVRQVMVSGEELPAAVVARFFDRLGGSELHNLYGPTEAAVDVTAWACRRPGGGAGGGGVAAQVSIGHPISNLQIHLLDAAGLPVPLGAPGEVHIGGTGVGRGYLARPELTADRFVPDAYGPWPGARLYRTGDLARRLPRGDLEYLGRRDHQVKIRGFRIELGEIEHALRALPGVRDAVATVRGGGSEPRLTAYLVVASGVAPAPATWRAALRRRLPEPMIPAAWQVLPALPLLPNGKVDRAALPAPSEGVAEAAAPAPRTWAEELVAAVWMQVLGCDRLGAGENLFDRGAHSLMVTRVAAQLRLQLGVELPVRRFFELPTVALLAAEIERRLGGTAARRLPAIRPVARDQPLPLSFAQQRLWFFDRWSPGSPAFNLATAVHLEGELDVAAMGASIDAIVERHQTLRCRFLDHRGEPVQVVEAFRAAALPLVDLAAVPAPGRLAESARLARQQARRAFDLERGPLLRVALLRLSPRRHLALLTLHHIVADGWSLWLFTRELSTAYRALAEGRPPALPELPIQFPDYAAWQRQCLQGELLAGELAFWREQLAGAPAALDLPSDRPRGPVQRYRGRRQAVALSCELRGRLRALGREAGATLFMVLATAWMALLRCYCRQADLTTGTLIANRHRPEVENLIGFFVNTLVLRARLDEGLTGRQALARLREVTLDLYAHQEVPFEKLVEELNPERHLSLTPLFQVLLIFQNAPAPVLELPGLSLELREVERHTAIYDLMLALEESGEQAGGFLEYDSDLFDRATAARWVGHYTSLLGWLTEAPDRRLASAPLLSAAERHQALREWNDAAWPAPAWTLDELVAEQAARRPHAVAASCGGQSVTYGELASRVERMAGALAGCGVGPDHVVALLADRGIAPLTAILALWRRRAVYLPLDPEHPERRLGQLLGQAGVGLVLAAHGRGAAAAAACGLLPEPRPRVVALAELLGAGPPAAAMPAPAAGAGDGARLAYVIFTSGSTGVPKGAMVEQRGMLNHLLAKVVDLELTAADVVAQTASPAFDISIWQLLAPLLAGGRVEIYADAVAHDPAALLARVAADGVTVLETVPSLLRLLLGEVERQAGGRPALPALRWLIATGEALGPELCRGWVAAYPGAAMLNAYGPTECSDDVSHHRVSGAVGAVGAATPAGGEAAVPIGRPVLNTQLYVLDAALSPVPAGVSGELCVGGTGVGRGYLLDPARTAAAFVPDPCAAVGGGRLYRTGDLARWRPDGCLDFLGRIDHQVKIRGFRLELGEIEAVLRQHGEVGQAVVLAGRPDDAGVAQLVAYVVPASPAPAVASPAAAPALGAEATGVDAGGLPARLRRHLAARLPEYMVPAHFVPLAALPVSRRGKLDRQALPVPGTDRTTARLTPARTRAERALATIWQELLGLGRVGVEDSFFELGGHSLLAIRALSRLRVELGVELTLRELFEAPSLGALAARVEAAMAGTAGDRDLIPALPLVPGEALPLAFAQERLWFLDQLDPASPAYNLPSAVSMTGAIAPAVLRRSLAEIVRRHAALRSTFSSIEGRPRLVVHRQVAVGLPVVDLEALPRAAAWAETLRLAAADARRPFDLARGPLLRTALLALGAEEQVLLLNLHHIVADAWSLAVLLSELAALVPAFAVGRPSPLAELPLQYADWARWQRQVLAGEPLRRQVAYWKEQLAGAPEALDLPGRGARLGAARLWQGGSRWLRLPAALTRRLRAAGRQEGTTLFMTLLAGFAGLLHRYSGATDLMIGMPVAGRDRIELEPLIGFFVNTLVARIRLARGQACRQLMQQVRQVVLDAFTHQDLPFEKLVSEINPGRDLDRSPLFQVMLALQNAPAGRIELPGLRLRRLEIETGTTRFELFLEIFEEGDELAGALHFSRNLFDAAFVIRFLQHFEALLQGIAGSPTSAISALPLLSAAEQAMLLREWNDSTAEPAMDAPFARLFERRAAAHPRRVAAACGAACVTYAELDRRAGALAARLRDRGLPAEAAVAVLAERGLDLLAALLGILKAGGAYLPLDPQQPAARVGRILGQGRCALVLVSRALLPLAGHALAAGGGGGAERPAVVVLEQALAPAPGAGTAAGVAAGAGDGARLAYVIFTSGSTGVPKGAMVEQRGMLNHLLAKVVDLELTAADVVAQTASPAFDISIWQLLAPLLAGGRVEIYADAVAHDPAALLARVAADGVTVLETVPSLLRLLLGEVERQAGGRPALPALRWLIATGEALGPELCRGWVAAYPGAAMLNAYGPTECSDDVSHHRVSGAVGAVGAAGAAAPAVGEAAVPIGRPVLNTQLYVLDAVLSPVPAGVSGELCVGGTGVGRGYLLDPARTAAAFVPDPCAAVGGGRLYRTGDLARWRPDGCLDFLGRIDHQVKIRGFRLELGEIEAALGEHPAVAAAAVCARPEAGGGQRLVAYVVARAEPAPPPQELRDHLKARLPDHAIPTAWMALAALPLAASGKLDRRALPEVDAGSGPTRPWVAPRNAVEAQVAAVFAAVTGSPRVGALDNFFELGGHSLLAAEAAWRLRKVFGLELELRAIFEAPAVEELAALIEDRVIAEVDVLSEDEVEALLDGAAAPALSPAERRPDGSPQGRYA